MSDSNKILYVRNVDDNLQVIIDSYKKKFNSKSEAQVVRRMINDFPRIVDLTVKLKIDLEDAQRELKILREEKRRILEVFKIQ